VHREGTGPLQMPALLPGRDPVIVHRHPPG